jgi:hypothetical protein
MGIFERHFIRVLREDCPVTYRTDATGKRVKIPCGAGYRQGKNGLGVVIKAGDTAKEDETGQMHSVPPCQHLKAGSNKKAIPVCPGEPTYEKNGQIISRKKKVKTESRRLSCLGLLRVTRDWSNAL